MLTTTTNMHIHLNTYQVRISLGNFIHVSDRQGCVLLLFFLLLFHKIHIFSSSKLCCHLIPHSNLYDSVETPIHEQEHTYTHTPFDYLGEFP